MSAMTGGRIDGNTIPAATISTDAIIATTEPHFSFIFP